MTTIYNTDGKRFVGRLLVKNCSVEKLFTDSFGENRWIQKDVYMVFTKITSQFSKITFTDLESNPIDIPIDITFYRDGKSEDQKHPREFVILWLNSYTIKHNYKPIFELNNAWVTDKEIEVIDNSLIITARIARERLEQKFRNERDFSPFTFHAFTT